MKNIKELRYILKHEDYISLNINQKINARSNYLKFCLHIKGKIKHDN